MTWLSDETIDRLRMLTVEPDFHGTRYTLLEEIGRGGMGVVYEADDRTVERRVAIKVLPAHRSSQADSERLRLEAKTIARLEHPGIVPIHDAGELPDGRVFYVMKLVRGVSLDRSMAGQERAGLLRVFLRICEAVAFAHAAGIVHRDLKPQNVMIGPFGEVLVMDWGLAVLSGARQESEIAGTPGFMAPEQERGETTTSVDIYALGGLLRFVATAASEDMPKQLTAIVRKAMSELPADRYESADALANDVTRFLDGLDVGAYRENVVERSGRWLAHNRVLVSLVCAYLIMRVIVFFVARR